MDAKSVFTPGSMPTVTFVGTHLQKRGEIFRDALDQGGTLINISGPSKSGKTVFVRDTVGAGNLVSIVGTGAKSASELWMRVFHKIGTQVPHSVGSEASNSVTLGASLKASGSLVFAKAEGAGSLSGQFSDRNSSTASTPIDHLQLLIQELGESGLVLFIDDFHYLDREVQNQVAAEIKEAIANGVKIVCASVPHHSEDVLKANADLRGRIVTIDFDYWDRPTLGVIAEKGFAALNINADPRVIQRFAAEAAGSPQLMQSLCLIACWEGKVRARPENPITWNFSEEFCGEVCSRAALGSDYSSTLDRLKEGPKTRGSERKSYRLAAGDVGDVYTIILRAIALAPPTLHFRYSELQERIRGLCESSAPSGSSVTGSCHHVALLANEGQPRPILEWDANEEVLNIRDPYLLFYMRWSAALDPDIR